MRFHFLKYCSLLLFLLATTASAQPAEKRVLFIVETSKDTKTLAEAERKVVAALIETGLGGLLEASDTLGVWTFDETLHVGKFPMQRWTPEGRKQIVQRTEDFLKMQPHAKSPRIETVWRPLQSVIRNSPALMVVLVTSGKQPVSGTPFDHEINQHLKNSARDYQKKKTPAVLILSATSGEILRYSINPAIGDVRIPVLTVPTNAAPAQIAQPVPKPKTTPPQPVRIATPPPPPKANTDAALIITKEGAQTASRIEADNISTDNFERNPAPQTGAFPHIPDLSKITGPVLLKHEAETITHTIAIEPPANATPVPPQLEKPSGPEIPLAKEAKVPEPAPVVAQVVPPVNAVPPVVPSTPAIQAQEKTITTEISKSAESQKPTATVSAVPAEVVSSVAPPTPPIAAAPPIEPTLPSAPVKTVSEPIPAIDSTNAVPVTTAEASLESPVHIAVPNDTTIQPQPLLAQSNPPQRSTAFLIGAMGLIIVAIILAFLVGRKIGTRPQQSLVSDWAERDRTKK